MKTCLNAQALSEVFTRNGYANFLMKDEKGGNITIYLRNGYEIQTFLNKDGQRITIDVLDSEYDLMDSIWNVPLKEIDVFQYIENMIKKYEMKGC